MDMLRRVRRALRVCEKKIARAVRARGDNKSVLCSRTARTTTSCSTLVSVNGTGANDLVSCALEFLFLLSPPSVLRGER
jgi:hypothetical protein